MTISLKQYETDIRDMKQQGRSIRDIAKVLSDKSKTKVSPSAIFRFLKSLECNIRQVPNLTPAGTLSDIPAPLVNPAETPGAPMPGEIRQKYQKSPADPILKYLHERFKDILTPTEADITTIKNTLTVKFLYERSVIFHYLSEYCMFRGWEKPRPDPAWISPRPEEEARYGRCWI